MTAHTLTVFMSTYPDPMPWGALILAMWPVWVVLGLVLGAILADWIYTRPRRPRESDRPLTKAEADEILARWRSARGRA